MRQWQEFWKGVAILSPFVGLCVWYYLGLYVTPLAFTIPKAILWFGFSVLKWTAVAAIGAAMLAILLRR